MKELRKMNRGLLLVGLWVIVALSVVFVQEFGAWFHMMLECVGRLFGAEAYVVQVTNYPAYLEGMYTKQHMQLLIMFWTFIAWGIFKIFGGRKVEVRFGIVVISFVLTTVLMEAGHYIAYVVEYLWDAFVSGIKGIEPSNELRDMVSLSYWKNVDWFARGCEGYILTRVVFFIAGIFEKKRKAQILKSTKSAKLKAEKECEYLRSQLENVERELRVEKRRNQRKLPLIPESTNTDSEEKGE